MVSKINTFVLRAKCRPHIMYSRALKVWGNTYSISLSSVNKKSKLDAKSNQLALVFDAVFDVALVHLFRRHSAYGCNFLWRPVLELIIWFCIELANRSNKCGIHWGNHQRRPMQWVSNASLISMCNFKVNLLMHLR